jgi:hypothetical protein
VANLAQFNAEGRIEQPDMVAEAVLRWFARYREESGLTASAIHSQGDNHDV